MRIFCPATLLLPHSCSGPCWDVTSRRSRRLVPTGLLLVGCADSPTLVGSPAGPALRSHVNSARWLSPPLFSCLWFTGPCGRACRPCSAPLFVTETATSRVGPGAPVRALVGYPASRRTRLKATRTVCLTSRQQPNPCSSLLRERFTTARPSAEPG